MRKVLLLLVIWVSASFALTLSEVRQSLKEAVAETDTVEAKVRSTVTTLVGTQTMEIHFVRKGPDKMLMEIKSPLLNQRSIQSGNRLQVTDLLTGKVQVLPYKGNELPWESVQAPNPLDTGNWSEPIALSDSLFMLSDSQGTQILYDSRLQRIVQMTQALENGQSKVSMEYDEAKTLKMILTEVEMQGYTTQMKMEFLQIRSAKNFPDRFFEF
jgi:outer membrane lipoprotein-sorting protein